MIIILCSDVADAVEFTQDCLQSFLDDACMGMFGVCGAAFPLDIIALHHDRSAIIRVPYEDRAKTRQALAAAIDWHGTRCRVSVKACSPFLINLPS